MKRSAKQQVLVEYLKQTFADVNGLYHPKHFAPEIAWCKMHIQGVAFVIGCCTDPIFNNVCQDKYHNF